MPRTNLSRSDPERGPRRTCVACREEGDRDELVRLVVDPTVEPPCVVVDYHARAPGRGAWVHPVAACVSALQAKPGALTRALDADRAIVGDLAAALRAQVDRAIADGLSMAQAAGALLGGHDMLVNGIRGGEVLELVIASDASDRTVDDLRAALSASPHPNAPVTRISLDREALGARIGKGSRAAVGVTPSRAATHLRRQLHRWRALG